MSLSCSWRSSIILIFLLFSLNVKASEVYCLKHSSQNEIFLDTCRSSRAHIAAAIQNQSNSTKKNKAKFDLLCHGTYTDECNHVKETLNKAVDIISTVFKFEAPIQINASFINFCKELGECRKQNKSVGQAYPTVSYMMVDQNDNMTRMYPQPLLKQFRNLSPKPNWLKYDIEAQFNNEVDWYFANDQSGIKNDQTDFLKNCLHELMHGLGFLTSWDDSLYDTLEPLFEDNTLKKFLTPMLLASTNTEEKPVNYNDKQPFWGFVEYPFDKFIYYKQEDSLKPLTSITRQLNHFEKSNALFNRILDFANAWYQSEAYEAALNVNQLAITPHAIQIIVNDTSIFTLETSIRPYLAGSSLCHVDKSTYLDSPDDLMVFIAKKGQEGGLNRWEKPISHKLLQTMASIGYSINMTDIVTMRPKLEYWVPSDSLAGFGSSDTMVTEANGPARVPKSSNSKMTSSANRIKLAGYMLLFSFLNIVYISL